jgi:predicted permease
MREIRQGVRSLSKTPALTAAAILTIALGIGANTAVYAVVHAVLLEPLPFREPQQLVQMWETHPELRNLQVSVPDYFDWKTSIHSLDLAAYSFQAMNKETLSGPGGPITVQGSNASSDLFSLLGIQSLIGRLYNAQEEAAKQPLILISERLWRMKFSADRGVIGKAIRVGGSSFTVVGVLPQRNAFPAWADFWTPLTLIDPGTFSTRKYHPLEVLGRLRAGHSIRDAELETEKMAGRLSRAYPATNGKIGAFVVPLMDMITGEVRPALIAVWSAAGLVLFIACANLAHLMMSRSLNRRREIALRLALGANRVTAFRTFLLESLLLSIAGGLLGIVAAYLVLPLIRRLAEGEIPRLDAVELNLPVLLFGFIAAALIAMLFALPSYFQVIQSNLNETISSATTRASARHSRLSSVLMSTEVALSLAVLLAAVLLVRSFGLAIGTDPGFRPDHTLATELPLVDGDWQKSYELFQNRIAPELESIAGVQEVAAVNAVPMSLGTTEHSRFATRFGIVGRQFEPGRFPTSQTRWCTANYFQLLGISLIRGRLLTEADNNQPRSLINEAFARRFFPNADPVGQKILLGVVSANPTSSEIVGVVADVREFGLTSAPEPTMYSIGVSPQMDVLVKTTTAAPGIRSAIAARIRRINPQKAIGPVKPLNDYVAASLGRLRFILSLIATFAGLAMCLCVVGIYGVFNYSVVRRSREFGIRSAIGAAASNIVAQVARECLGVIVPGVLAGLLVSIACARLMRVLLYRVSPTDAGSSLLAALLILLLCFGSVMLPAWRAAKVDPVTVLREQ